MCLYLVEALVVERGQELGVSRRAVRVDDAQRPLLLLSWCKTVAERCPLHPQTGVGQRTGDAGLMAVHLAVLHPAVGEQQTVTVLLLIRQLEVDKSVAYVAVAAVYHLVAGIDGIDDVQIRVGGSHLQGDGLAIAGEARATQVEPVVGFLGGRRVVEREHGERLLQRLASADGIERMPAALQFGDVHLVVGARREPLATVEAVFYLLGQFIARGIAQREADGAALLAEHLVGQVGTEGQRLVAHRQRHGASMCLTRLVGDVGGDHEVIEHGVAGLGHHDGHADGERSVVARHGLALSQHLVVALTADDHLVPVRVVREPPVGPAAHYLVLHLRALHLHATVCAGRTHHVDRVAIGVGRLHARNLHLERRTLVLLHAESFAVGALIFAAATFAAGLNAVDSGQTRRWQFKVGGTGAVVVGHHLLRGHRLVVGIEKLHSDLHPSVDSVINLLIAVVEDDGGMDHLPRTVHLTVGIDAAAVTFLAA